MVTLCKKPPNSLEPKTHLILHQIPLSPFTQPPHTLDAVPQDYPLQLIPGGNRAHIPFRVSELKEIRI
jgi:hypothetical protein